MDYSLFRQINHLADRTHWAHWFFIDFSKYGIVMFGVLLAGGWYLVRRDADRRALASLICGVIGVFVGLGLAQIIGGAVDRARPFATHANMHLLIDRTSDFSFPSDHATVAGACTMGLFLVSRRLGIASACFALVMSFSRVYVGTHYPGDVVAGLALGAATVAIVVPLLRPLILRLLGMVSKTPLAALIQPTLK